MTIKQYEKAIRKELAERVSFPRERGAMLRRYLKGNDLQLDHDAGMEPGDVAEGIAHDYAERVHCRIHGSLFGSMV